MPISKIVIIGAGFAGVWSALSAKRLLDLTNTKDIEVVVISPEPSLVIRPRLSVVRPESITGIQQHAFDIDSLDSAVKLEAQLVYLVSLPVSPARDTVVVCGAGFTGIELLTELPKRLAHINNARIILVDNAEVLGSTLGPGPRPIITKAIKDLGIEVKLGSAVTDIDSEGLTLASGERIESKTVVWTAGMRATPLIMQIPGHKDNFSRLYVNQHLQVPLAKHVFATGDAACALADSDGHYTLMSCQHALRLGRVSGHNAVVDLLGELMVEYS